MARERLRRKGYSPRKAEELAAELLADEVLKDPMFLKCWEKLAPLSTTFPARDADRLIEAAAILRLPEVAWLRKYLETREGPGRTAATLPVAILFAMAIEGGRPEILPTSRLFERADAARGWAYGYPTVARRSSTYDVFHSTLERHDPNAILHVQVELIKQLAKLVEQPGKPKVGEYLVVDGSQQQANVSQVAPMNQEHADFLQSSYEGIAFVRHVRGDGSEQKRNHGYNIVVISDLMTSLPLVYAPFPATVDEREAATVLLEMLFWLWPDCPAEFLVGDSLYDHSNQFAIDLECKWGIHPVFSVHGRRDHQEIDGTVDGVPKCVHGFMKREKADDFVAGTRRLKKGLRRGEDIGHRKARLRWCCVAEICPRRTTYFARDPRKHTYMPIAGDHMLRFKREALLCRRNSIEQVFSFLKMGGFFGPGALRAKWAKTLREACWAYMLPMLFMTARRLVHEMGAYDESLGLADRLGLLQSPTLWSPTPGPDPLTLAVSQQQLPLEIRAPGTWMGP